MNGLQLPSDYMLAQRRARRKGRIFAVHCRRHPGGHSIGEVWDTSEGAMLVADVTLEENEAVAGMVNKLKREAGRHVPPVVYLVRFLIEHPSPDDPPKVRCAKCGLRPLTHAALLEAVQKYRTAAA